MNRLKLILIISVSLFMCFNLYPYWKKDVSRYFSTMRHDYEGATRFLLNNIDSIKKNELNAATSLLAYSFNKMGNKANEIVWIKVFFENHKGLKADFSFLSDIINIDIREYINSWKRKYPHIKEIKLLNEKEFSFDKRPDKLRLLIDISNVSNFNLIKGNILLMKNTISIDSGMLKKGKRWPWHYLSP